MDTDQLGTFQRAAMSPILSSPSLSSILLGYTTLHSCWNKKITIITDLFFISFSSIYTAYRWLCFLDLDFVSPIDKILTIDVSVTRCRVLGQDSNPRLPGSKSCALTGQALANARPRSSGVSRTHVVLQVSPWIPHVWRPVQRILLWLRARLVTS